MKEQPPSRWQEPAAEGIPQHTGGLEAGGGASREQAPVNGAPWRAGADKAFKGHERHQKRLWNFLQGPHTSASVLMALGLNVGAWAGHVGFTTAESFWLEVNKRTTWGL